MAISFQIIFWIDHELNRHQMALFPMQGGLGAGTQVENNQVDKEILVHNCFIRCGLPAFSEIPGTAVPCTYM